MPAHTGDEDSPLPPGTVQLEHLQLSSPNEIILQPQPTRDPNDPLNWQSWRKNLNFALVSYYVLMVFSFIDCFPVTWAPVNKELGFSFDLMNDAYAAGCGALCVGGPLFVGFALKYGRRSIYLASTAVQLAMSAWFAKMETVADMMLVNIFSNMVGALAEVMVQMTVADVYFVHRRGLMNSIYVLTMTAGASLAPLAAGYVTVSQGWRWVWWWHVILFGAGFLAFLFLYEETKFSGVSVLNAPDNSQGEKTQHTDKGDVEKLEDISKPAAQLTTISTDPSIPKRTYWEKLALWSTSPSSFSQLARHVYEPFLILFSIPAIFYVSIMYGFMTACITVTVTTMSAQMPQPPYNFDPSAIGLMNLPTFIGTIIGAFMYGPLSDYLIVFQAKRNGAMYEPEMRLWILPVIAPFVLAGLLMIGFALNDGLPWPIVAVGLGLVGFGVTPACSAGLTYLTDGYTEIIADSLVAVTFIRNLISTIFVFARPPWIDDIGVSGFYISFGLIVAAIMFSALVFSFFGRLFRAKLASRYRYFASNQMDSRG